jgi:rod shape-determining protein MreC
MRNLLYFIIRNYYVFLFLLLEGISFILVFRFNAFQRSGFTAVTRTFTANIRDNLSGIRNYINIRQYNEILTLENARLRNEIANMGRFDKMPGFVIDSSSLSAFRYIPARVISNSVNRQYNYIIINKGNLDGVSPDMAVICETGVVGIVIGVSEHYSTVIPVLNRNFRLSAKLKNSNYFGIIQWEGRSSDQVDLREIPVHIEVNSGDTVVTSGYSAVFPEGVNIGYIEEINDSEGNFHDIRLKLITDFRNLYYVNVIRNLNRDEIEALRQKTIND